MGQGSRERSVIVCGMCFRVGGTAYQTQASNFPCLASGVSLHIFCMPDRGHLLVAPPCKSCNKQQYYKPKKRVLDLCNHGFKAPVSPLFQLEFEHFEIKRVNLHSFILYTCHLKYLRCVFVVICTVFTGPGSPPYRWKVCRTTCND